MSNLSVKRGHTQLASPDAAVRDLVTQIDQPDARLAIVFCSTRYDLAAVGRALQAGFACPVLACSTAGEISSEVGYAEGHLVGATIASEELTVRTHFMPSLRTFVDTGGFLPPALLSTLSSQTRGFALLLLDGLAMLEDMVTAMIHAQLGGLPLVGGSAGDPQTMTATYVYHDGAFHEGAGVVALVETSLPFAPFMLQHFEPTGERLVVTESDVALRTLKEINGRPAAEEFARLTGVSPDELAGPHFARNAMMLRVGGRDYLRSVQHLNDDGSLRCFCAIDEGLVLRIAQPTDLVGHLREQLTHVVDEVPNPQLVLGFDCILRRIEITTHAREDAVAHVLAPLPLLGFSTYGEQFNGLHMNQTLTGLVLGGAS